MKRVILKAFTPIIVLCVSQTSYAQVLTYADCVVHDVPSLMAAIDRGEGLLPAGARPGAVYVDQWMFNGEIEATHRIIAAFPDYAGLQAYMGALVTASAEIVSVGLSLEHAADCRTDGLAVLRGAWGNQDAPGVFWQVYGVSASDGAAYTAAIEALSVAQGDAAPGPIVLFENRGGITSDTHLVAIGAPTFVALNNYLDELFASDDFEDFLDDVGESRTITWRTQAVRIRSSQPQGN